MSKFYCITLLLFCISFAVLAQRTAIKGKIVEGVHMVPQRGVTVFVKKKVDTSIISSAISDDLGVFELSVPTAVHDSLILIATEVGFAPYKSQPWIIQNPINFNRIVLDQTATNLKEIAVVSRKPFIVQKNDRITVNIENSAVSNSGTAYDMLQKLPGVIMDVQGNISLRGKQGVKVFLNGRETYLSGNDLANLLKSVPSNNVSTVDIITNPSAKFDASGNAGIIIINTKKDTKDLYAITINSNSGYGKYLQTSNGLNLAFNQKGFFLYGSYFYNNRNTFRYSDLNRIVNNDQGTFNFKQQSNGKLHDAGSTYNFNGGLNIGTKSKIGFSMDGFYNDNHVAEINNTYINTPPSPLDSSLIVNNHEVKRTNSISTGVSYDLQLDTGGGKLHYESNYSYYNNNGIGQLLTNFYDRENNAYRSPNSVLNITPTSIHIFTTQLDLNGKIPMNINYELGGKISDVRTDNNYKFESGDNPNFIIDSSRVDHFKYIENIYAGYVNLSKKIKNFSIQTGLRIEHTDSKSVSLSTSESSKRIYNNLFPSIFLQEDINADNQINLSFSRRIDRPSYQDLNPFVYYNDKYTYTVGNPLLKPQFTNNFQFSYTFKQLSITAGYSYTTDAISQITQQIDSSKITYATIVNLNKLTNYSLSISYPLTITTWWDSYIYTEGFRNKYQSELSGQTLNNGKFTLNFFTEQDFKIATNLSSSVSFNYRSSAYNGIYYFKPVSFLNAGLADKFLDKKLTLRLSFDDILNTLKTRVITNYANMNYQLTSGRDTRRVMFGITYIIGSKKLKSTDQSTPNKEERSRIKE